MAKKNRIGLNFTGWEEMIPKLGEVEGDVKSAVNDALKESQTIVAHAAIDAMQPHHRYGKTEESIVDDHVVNWEGTTAEVKVGFNLKNGGMPSIFLMYGTPRTAKDQRVYDAVYGNRIQKQVAKKQQEIITAAITERMG